MVDQKLIKSTTSFAPPTFTVVTAAVDGAAPLEKDANVGTDWKFTPPNGPASAGRPVVAATVTGG